jgi:tetratricopeptide (TPR) repeat protein
MAAEPSNPESSIALANYYYGKAKQERADLSTKPPAPGDLTITDPKTDDVVGSLSFTTSWDPATGGKARDVLLEAVKKFPERVDIRLGLAFVQQELGDADGQYATIAQLVEFASAAPADLRWKGGSALPGAPETFIPETVQPYLAHYYNLATPEDDERFVRIARLLAAAYPNHPYPHNSIAMYHTSRREWDKAVPYLETAHRLAPKDPLVLMNLGEVSLRRNDRAKARAWFQLVLETDAEEELKARARERLAEPR